MKHIKGYIMVRLSFCHILCTCSPEKCAPDSSPQGACPQSPAPHGRMQRVLRTWLSPPVPRPDPPGQQLYDFV